MAFSEETVAEIRRLLAASGMSQRQIATVCHVSRGTVCAIAGGRRRQRLKRKPPDAEPFDPAAPPGRCLECGAQVRMPCYACQLRLRRQPRAPSPDVAVHPDLDLRSPEQARYREVVDERIAAGELPVPGPREAWAGDDEEPSHGELMAIDREG